MSLVLLLQGLFFILFISREPRLESADLIVVFEGRCDRARKAYALADDNYAPVLVVSPATPGKLEKYDRWFKPKSKVDRIIEKNARTTFENALYSGRIVKNNHFSEVILVTSWDHMPRSYLLLKIELLNTDIRINPYPVATGKLNRGNWYRHPAGWKMIYNEMIEIWGSLIELAKYRTTGRLSEIEIGKTGFMNRIKNVLLFKIDQQVLSDTKL